MSIGWQQDAKCASGVDPDIFYPPKEKEEYKLILAQAKAVCFGKDGNLPCPVRKSCLIEAIETDEEHGIWGGLSPRERGALKRKVKRLGKTLAEYI